MEVSAYRLHILRFRSSSCSMRFIFLVQKQAAPIDAAKRAADKYHGMMQSGYTMQASSHNGRTNPKTTTPILRNGTAARLMIDVFFKIMTSSLIFLRLRVLKAFSPDLFFQEREIHKELPPGIDSWASALSHELSDVILSCNACVGGLTNRNKFRGIVAYILKQFQAPFPSLEFSALIFMVSIWKRKDIKFFRFVVILCILKFVTVI